MVSHYSRLFGGPFPGHDEAHLRELSAQMKDVPQNRRGRPRLGDLAPSGFVYLGQFLDHDLTCDETPLENASRAPESTANQHVPSLNLESVYGGGPAKSPELYDLSQREAESFLLGRTVKIPAQGISSTLDDFHRCNGKAMLGDDRNDQHLIISQLHVVFLQVHNRLIDCLKRGLFRSECLPNETVFATARRLTTWHYQWIVRHEFLAWFVLPRVLADIEQHGPRLFERRNSEQTASLPIEFTQAAFRFGHSVVQPQYDINKWIGLVPLRDLVRKKRNGNGSLPANRVVDWDRFTRSWGGNANFAENINTLVSEDLFDLPAASMPVPSKNKPPPLPEITLLRGSRIGLPSGQEACRQTGLKPLRADQIGFDDEANKFLRERDFDENTPLWYYVLREAELLGRRRLRGGECLGPLGSRIVAEVLLGVMKSDPQHYLNAAPEWQPPTAIFGHVCEPRRIDSLRKFIAFAKDRQPLSVALQS